MFAIDTRTLDLCGEPFPHAVVDGIFEESAFEALAQSYPICPPASGPTGFTIHRGDPEFDAVMTSSPAWRDFFRYSNSEPFINSMTDMFGEEIERSCLIDRNAINFADYIETRTDKEKGRIEQPALPAEAMFIRFDFMQGMDSYVRQPHLDHRRRLATVLIYFDTPGPDTFMGGDLLLHDKSGLEVKRISPKANRAVFFPCSEKSWHSVNAVTQCQKPRRFLQISVSSCHDIWPDGKGPVAKSLAFGKNAVRKILAMAS